MKVAFYTLGCKLNQAETESLAGQFSKAGYQLVSPGDMADVYIANTCTVTHIADRKSRHWLRLARRRNPQALIIATGCYAQRAPEELAPIADFVLGNEEKEHLLETIKGLPLRAHPFAIASPSLCHCARSEAISSTSRVRSLIKIQDGCHSPCAYCIVPRVRAREYSVPASQVIGEIKEKVAMGYKEVVLTGTKVGTYRDGGISLRDLVECILCDTNIERLHLSSLQPQEISPEFLALWQDSILSIGEGFRLCRHFHLALQSGSDSMLQRMRRHYSLDDYQKVVSLIKEAIPGVAITTDVIVGFPGESDEEFEQSYRFCQQARFANIHVFPFSPRPRTQAAKMLNQVSDSVKKQRSRRMLKLSQLSKHNFEEQFLGRTMPVLWEKETSPGSNIYSGLTDNYIRVFTQSKESLSNKIVPTKLVEFHNSGMWGELIESPG